MERITKNKKAFTLIELMVAIAIIGVLSAVVLVSVKEYGQKARGSRAKAQASSAIFPLVSCFTNGGTKNDPATYGGNNICSYGSGYGTWPSTDAIKYSYSAVTGSSAGSWFFVISSSADGIYICCNSTMNSCGEVNSSAACNLSANSW